MSDLSITAARAGTQGIGPGVHAVHRPAATVHTDVAAQFEAAFLAEMLRHSGLTDAFGDAAGGGGETGFTDILVREIATEIAETRPLGIGERLARDLAGWGGA